MDTINTNTTLTKSYTYTYQYLKIHMNPHDAQDLMQDIMLDFLRLGNKIKTIENLECYIFKMAQHAMYKKKKSIQLNTFYLEDFTHMNTIDPTESIEESPLYTFEEKIQDAIDSLPNRQKEILTMSRFEGLSHKEIASKIGIAQSTINNHISHAMKTLKDILTPKKCD